MSIQPTIRPATQADMEASHDVMWASVTDFGARNGTPLQGTAAEWWAGGEPLQRFLATHAAEWWVAEEPASGRLIAYARSVERGGLLELTEFFVLPSNQSRGLGRQLIERAFPAGRGDVRSIIATTDVRALARYYGAGTVARFPILTIGGVPRAAGVDGDPGGDLAPQRLDPKSDDDLEAVRAIEAGLIEYARGLDELRWLLEVREGYLYRRGGKGRRGEPVGYGFVGKPGTGPVGAVDPALLPAILLHLEDRAAQVGLEQIEFQVPSPNEVATRHLLGRGLRIDPWINLLMSNRPFGAFDRFLGFGPPVFL
jgi:GNAT superfamily N-acetyltransferase